MYSDAAQVETVDDEAAITNSPFHFDLIGLAQGLNKTVTAANKVAKLKQHVDDAQKTL